MEGFCQAFILSNEQNLEWADIFFLRMLEQNVFNIASLSFDDNKVLKVQLNMLIFVQVCLTIDKIYKSKNKVLVQDEQLRAKGSTRETCLQV
jgi:hypothetical protein